MTGVQTCALPIFISGISYTAQMNLSTEKQLMDLQNRLVVAKGEGRGREWGGWGAWG